MGEVKEARAVRVAVIIMEARVVKVVITTPRVVKDVISETKPKYCLPNNIDGVSGNIFEYYNMNECSVIKRFMVTIAAFFNSHAVKSLSQIHDASKYGVPTIFTNLL